MDQLVVTLVLPDFSQRLIFLHIEFQVVEIEEL